MVLVEEASSAQEGIEQFRKHQPDVTLMDLRLPDKSGIEALKAIRAEFPEARIILLTTFEGDVEIQHELQAGAQAYVLKSTPSKRTAGSNRPSLCRKETHSFPSSRAFG